MHQQISEQTGTRVFFCDAHSPRQRGSNENLNGLLRDYFPVASLKVVCVRPADGRGVGT
jgi:transposase, IS30 family